MALDWRGFKKYISLLKSLSKLSWALGLPDTVQLLIKDRSFKRLRSYLTKLGKVRAIRWKKHPCLAFEPILVRLEIELKNTSPNLLKSNHLNPFHFGFELNPDRCFKVLNNLGLNNFRKAEFSSKYGKEDGTISYAL